MQDCDYFNLHYPNCSIYYLLALGNGVCNGHPFNTIECGFDGNDCDWINEHYPNCNVSQPSFVGDGKFSKVNLYYVSQMLLKNSNLYRVL